MSTHQKTIIDSIQKNGYAKLENFFSDSDLQLISKKLQNVSSKKLTKGLSYFPVNTKNYLATLLDLNLKKILQGIFLKRLTKRYELEELSDKYFGKKSELITVDSYFSPKSDEMIVDWHADVPGDLPIKPDQYQSWNRSLKFFIYLTDVDHNNGCLAFLPNSNLICKKVTELILKKKIKVGRITELSKFRNILVNNKELKYLIESDVNIGKEKLEKFINDSAFINSGDTENFDLPLKKGGMIIFDEFGFHRGGCPAKTDRTVLRFFYREKY